MEVSAPIHEHPKMLVSKQVEFNDPYRVQSILEAVYKRCSLNITCSQLFSLGFFFSQFYVHLLEHCKSQSFGKSFRKSLQVLQKVKISNPISPALTGYRQVWLLFSGLTVWDDEHVWRARCFFPVPALVNMFSTL